jgi:hypothetical protein
MARVKNGFGKALSGSLGQLVFVNCGETTYVRTLPRERKPSEWSADQKNNRNCFAGVVKYASRMMKSFVKPIWNRAIPGSRGFQLFVKANKPAFGTHGTVANPGLLRFSAGALPFPLNMRVSLLAEQPGIISVSWKNQIISPVRGDDHLMLVFYDPYDSAAPIEAGFSRKDEHARIALPEKPGQEIYLYLFFKSADETLYSIDQVFKIIVQ